MLKGKRGSTGAGQRNAFKRASFISRPPRLTARSRENTRRVFCTLHTRPVMKLANFRGWQKYAHPVQRLNVVIRSRFFEGPKRKHEECTHWLNNCRGNFLHWIVLYSVRDCCWPLLCGGKRGWKSGKFEAGYHSSPPVLENSGFWRFGDSLWFLRGVVSLHRWNCRNWNFQTTFNIVNWELEPRAGLNILRW